MIRGLVLLGSCGLAVAILSYWPVRTATVVVAAPAAEGSPHLMIETAAGTVLVQLDADSPEGELDRLKFYVDRHVYDGTVFDSATPNGLLSGGTNFASGEMRMVRHLNSTDNDALGWRASERGTFGLVAYGTEGTDVTHELYISLGANPSIDHCLLPLGEVVGGWDVVETLATAAEAGAATAEIRSIAISE